MPRSAPYEKSKFLGSGGSMVARLKLKEIDGRAPDFPHLWCLFRPIYSVRPFNCMDGGIADLQPL
jgi:hypothetical protein